MYNLFKVNRSCGYENPDVYVDTPVSVYPSDTGWIVEDVVTGTETEFSSREDAEAYAARIEGHYEYGDDMSYEEEY